MALETAGAGATTVTVADTTLEATAFVDTDVGDADAETVALETDAGVGDTAGDAVAGLEAVEPVTGMGRGGLLGAAMIGFAGAIGVALVTAAGLGLTTALGLALAATGVGAAFVALALFVDEFAAAVGDADALALFVGKLAAVVGDAGALAPFVAEFAAAVGDAGAAFALALFVGFVALFVDEFAAAVGDAGAAVGVAVGPSANAEAGDSKVITIAKVSHTVKERIRCIKTAGQRKIKNRLAIVLRSVTPLAPSGLGVQVSNRPEINAPACVSCHCEEAVCADEAIPMLLGRFAASLRSQ